MTRFQNSVYIIAPWFLIYTCSRVRLRLSIAVGLFEGFEGGLTKAVGVTPPKISQECKTIRARVIQDSVAGLGLASPFHGEGMCSRGGGATASCEQRLESEGE